MDSKTKCFQARTNCETKLGRRMLGAERYEDFARVALCVVGLACDKATVAPYVDTVE